MPVSAELVLVNRSTPGTQASAFKWPGWGDAVPRMAEALGQNSEKMLDELPNQWPSSIPVCVVYSSRQDTPYSFAFDAQPPFTIHPGSCLQVDGDGVVWEWSSTLQYTTRHPVDFPHRYMAGDPQDISDLEAGVMKVSSHEIEQARKATLDRARRRHLLKVEVEPEVIPVNDTFHLKATFFSRSAFHLTPEELDHVTPEDLETTPVVEALGELGKGESQKTHLKRISRGTYDCRITPTQTGSRAYLVKERDEAEVGTLVQVEVLDRDTVRSLKDLYSGFRTTS